MPARKTRLSCAECGTPAKRRPGLYCRRCGAQVITELLPGPIPTHQPHLRVSVGSGQLTWDDVAWLRDRGSSGATWRGWALEIVTRRGGAVTAWQTGDGRPTARPETLAWMRREARRHGKQAVLTGSLTSRPSGFWTNRPVAAGLYPDPGRSKGLRQWTGAEWSPYLLVDPAGDMPDLEAWPVHVWSPLPSSFPEALKRQQRRRAHGPAAATPPAFADAPGTEPREMGEFPAGTAQPTGSPPAYRPLILADLTMDDEGITIGSSDHPWMICWRDVRWLRDGYAYAGSSRPRWRWALQIVLRDGELVNAIGPSNRTAVDEDTLTAIEDFARRQAIPIVLTGQPIAGPTITDYPLCVKIYHDPAENKLYRDPAVPGIYPDPAGALGLREWTGAEWSPFLKVDPAVRGPGRGQRQGGMWSPLSEAQLDAMRAARMRRRSPRYTARLAAKATGALVMAIIGSGIPLIVWWADRRRLRSLRKFAAALQAEAALSAPEDTAPEDTAPEDSGAAQDLPA